MRIIWITVLTLIGFVILLVSPTLGDETNSVISDIEVYISTGTNFTVHINMDVKKIFLSASGVTYTAEDIESFANNNHEIMGAIKYALKGLILNQLKQSFKDTKIIPLRELPTYENKLFHDEYEIDLTPRFFNINESINIYDLVNGLINIGGIINYTFPLHADEGWKNTYIFILPNPMTFKRTTGSVENNEITWTIDNKEGMYPQKKAELSLLSKKPSNIGRSTDDISINFILNAEETKKIELKSEIIMRNLGLDNYNVLPDFIYNISGLQADGIRLCVNNNMLSWENIYEKTLYPIGYKIVKILENSSLNQSLQMIFSWDSNTTTKCREPYNISYMDDEPPVKGILEDNQVNLTICKLTARAVFGLVNAGAKVTLKQGDINFGDNLENIGLPYTGLFILPNHISLDGKNPYKWNENHSIIGSMTSDIAPNYKKEEINTSIEISLENMDLNLLNFFSGKTEITTEIYLKDQEYRSVSKIPSNCNLPSEINISFLNADAIRICVDENVFTSDEIKTFLNNEAEMFKILAQGILPSVDINAKSDENAFRESLRWDENISNMDEKNPVNIVSKIHTFYPISFSFSFIPPTFEVLPWNLTLTGIQNQNVTYRIILPEGVSVKVDDTLGKTLIKKLDDKYVIEITFSETEASLADELSIKIHPTLLFIIGLFSPCLLSMAIAVILLIIIYIIRKKRKKGYPSGKMQNYEEQEYYIPPPPHNK